MSVAPPGRARRRAPTDTPAVRVPDHPEEDLVAWQPTDPRDRARRNRRVAVVVVVALLATFVVPALAIVLG